MTKKQTSEPCAEQSHFHICNDVRKATSMVIAMTTRADKHPLTSPPHPTKTAAVRYRLNELQCKLWRGNWYCSFICYVFVTKTMSSRVTEVRKSAVWCLWKKFCVTECTPLPRSWTGFISGHGAQCSVLLRKWAAWIFIALATLWPGGIRAVCVVQNEASCLYPVYIHPHHKSLCFTISVLSLLLFSPFMLQMGNQSW